MKHFALLCLVVALPTLASTVEWVRPSGDKPEMRWGVKGKLMFAIPPYMNEPRGLIRILYPTLPEGRYDLINFVAVEPTVAGVRGFSEMEHSALDDVQGKRISTATPAGTVTRLPNGIEELSVDFEVEKFGNGASVSMRVSIRSDRPDEVRFTLHAKKDSKPMDFCTLSATMGNKARARTLWLKDGTESSLKLWPALTGTGFSNSMPFPSSRMFKTPSGDLMAAITTDEKDPAKATMPAGSEGWEYTGEPVTQYWLKPAGGRAKPFEVVVNARAAYWGNGLPIPGGPAFENFELDERFEDGQVFVFGVTRRPPSQLGFPASK